MKVSCEPFSIVDLLIPVSAADVESLLQYSHYFEFYNNGCCVSTEMLQKALSGIVEISFNCLSIDGDTSTNDMVSFMANGAAGNPEITMEGATRLLEYSCIGCPDRQTAVCIAKRVVWSSLARCLLFGCDANWGPDYVCGRIYRSRFSYR